MYSRNPATSNLPFDAPLQACSCKGCRFIPDADVCNPSRCAHGHYSTATYSCEAASKTCLDTLRHELRVIDMHTHVEWRARASPKQGTSAVGWAVLRTPYSPLLWTVGRGLIAVPRSRSRQPCESLDASSSPSPLIGQRAKLATSGASGRPYLPDSPRLPAEPRRRCRHLDAIDNSQSPSSCCLDALRLPVVQLPLFRSVSPGLDAVVSRASASSPRRTKVHLASADWKSRSSGHDARVPLVGASTYSEGRPHHDACLVWSQYGSCPAVCPPPRVIAGSPPPSTIQRQHSVCLALLRLHWAVVGHQRLQTDWAPEAPSWSRYQIIAIPACIYGPAIAGHGSPASTVVTFIGLDTLQTSQRRLISFLGPASSLMHR